MADFAVQTNANCFASNSIFAAACAFEPTILYLPEKFKKGNGHDSSKRVTVTFSKKKVQNASLLFFLLRWEKSLYNLDDEDDDGEAFKFNTMTW